MQFAALIYSKHSLNPKLMLNLPAALSPSSMSLGGTSHLKILHQFAGKFQDNLLKEFCNLDALAAFLGLG